MKPITASSLIWRNIRGRPYRNIAALLCFAFIASTIFSAQYLISGAENSITSGVSRMGADLLVVPEQFGGASEEIILTGKSSTFFFDRPVTEEVIRIQGVDAASPQIFVATLKDAPCCSLPVQLIGFDPARDFTILPWLASEKRSLGPDDVIVGSRIIGDVGTRLEFYGHPVTIAGRLEPTGTGLDTAVFVPMNTTYVMAEESAEKAVQKLELLPGQISAILVRCEEGTNIHEVASRIQAQVPGTRVISSNSLLQIVKSHLSGTTQILYVLATAVTAISFPLIALISSMVVHERRREIGLIRAMGGKRGFIFRMIIMEAVILASIGALVGIFASAILVTSFQNYIMVSLEVPFIWPAPWDMVRIGGLSLVFTVAIGSASSLFPAIQSSRQHPYDAIRGGE